MIATVDYGGTGPTLLLLHGAGGNAHDWDRIAPALADTHRVVAADLPGHGESPPLASPWTFGAVLAELDALNLDNPAVAGMSLGGMLAVHWGHTHPNCPAVISIDGHRPPLTDPTNYPGLDDETMTIARDQLRANFEAITAAAPPEQAATLGGVFSAMQADDTIPLLSTLRPSTLVALASRSMPGTEEFEDLLAAHRRGVARDLTTAAEQNPRLTVVNLSASHAAHHEIPHELGQLIAEHAPTPPRARSAGKS